MVEERVIYCILVHVLVLTILRIIPQVVGESNQDGLWSVTAS